MTKILMILTVLSSFLTNLETKTMQSDFTVKVMDKSGAPLNYVGGLTMQGDQFVLDMVDLRAAYDGKTMYLYSPQTDELTLTYPTEEELKQNNPFLFAKALVPVCEVKEILSEDGQKAQIIMVPKDQSIGIKRFKLKLNAVDLLPIEIEILEENHKSTALKFTNPKYLTKQQEFILRPEESTYVNDLRL